MFQKFQKIVILSLVIIDLQLADFEIRHERAKLTRSRRHGRYLHKSQKFYSNYDNVININSYATENSLIHNNISITSLDEHLVIKFSRGPTLPEFDPSLVRDRSNSDANIKTNSSIHSNNTWQYIDQSVLYMGEEKVVKSNDDYSNKTDSNLFQSDSNKPRDTLKDGKSQEKSDRGHVDIVSRFLRIVESQQIKNCSAGTDLNLGEGVVDRYAQDRFRVEADFAVNRANMLTRIWKYADPNVVASEDLLYAMVYSMVEFNDDVFAAGNCYDKYQYKDYLLFCPYAYRLPEGAILVKDLSVEYKYLGNTSEWFYVTRQKADRVIRNHNQFIRGGWN